MRHVVRKRILDRDGHKCVQCGATERLEIDHIQPLSKGGRHDEANMQVLCKSCNASKGNKYDWSEYFIFDKSPEYLMVNRAFSDLIKPLGLRQYGRVLQWAFDEHARIWGLERGYL